MDGCNPNWTPASQVALGANPDCSEKHKDCFKWSYATAVGMLQYLAMNTRPDTLSWSKAMDNIENCDRWITAAHAKITILEANNTWREVTKSSAEAKIISGTWVFRRKHTPDGEIKKYKVRYCCCGDLLEDTQNTFAPVVHWPTV
jgi:hypothetical protein